MTPAYSAGWGFGGSRCNICVDGAAYGGKAGSQLVSFLGGATGSRDDGRQAVDAAGLVRLDEVAHDGSAGSNDPRVAGHRLRPGSYDGSRAWSYSR